jgi:hypothetical protein
MSLSSQVRRFKGQCKAWNPKMLSKNNEWMSMLLPQGIYHIAKL